MKYYLYKRAGSSGRGVQVSEKKVQQVRAVAHSGVHVKRTLRKRDPSPVIGGGYW